MDKKTVKAWAVLMDDAIFCARPNHYGVFADKERAEGHAKTFIEEKKVVPCTITYELPTS